MKSITHPVWTERAAAATVSASRWSFAAALVLIPFRLRLVLLARPTLPLYADYTGLLLFASDAAVLGTLALWAISLLLSPRALSLGPPLLWIPLAALTVIGGVSAVVSYDPLISVYHAVRFLILFWFYVFIVNEIRSVGWIVVPVTIQVTLQSLVALAQFTAQHSVDLQALGELQLDPAWSGIGIVVANGVRLLRAYGLTDNPNILGGCLAFGLVFLLGAYLHGSFRALILAAFAAGTPALLETFSRAAWLAFLAGCAVILLVEVAYRRWAALRSLVSLATICSILLASILLSYARFFGVRLDVGSSFNVPSVEQQSLGERAILIQASIPMLLAHPLLGVGLGASAIAFQHQYPVFDVPYEPPHLTILEAALETGLPGALAYLVAVLGPFFIYLRHRRYLFADRFATASVALLLSIAVVGLFDYYTWLLVAGRLWQWLAWGIWGLVFIQWRSLQLTPLPLAAQKVGVSV